VIQTVPSYGYGGFGGFGGFGGGYYAPSYGKIALFETDLAHSFQGHTATSQL
jgi:hypothetical protein